VLVIGDSPRLVSERRVAARLTRRL